uniref:helix-turn-helix domain-containing protein n=1 Tax=Aliarcobacter sp. TaxID=2321116 RepID=UPI004048D062
MDLSNFESKNILNRIKIALQSKNFEEVAEHLSISPATINTWRHRGKIPEVYLLKVVQMTGVSLEWLLSEDKPTFHISGGSKNISQVNGGVGIQETPKNNDKDIDELELFEEFKKIENLAKMVNQIDFLKDELEKIKEELKKYI